MKKSTAYIIAGSSFGLLVGSSMGVAVGGTAFNAAFFVVPLGGFVGWLLASRNDAQTGHQPEIAPAATLETINSQSRPSIKSNGGFASIVHSALAILATIWNFQIEILSALGILPTFVRQPLLFAGLCIVISVFFPPFLALYFFAWLGANHFGLSEENQFRSVIV
jgi:hypothetical protein